MEKNIKQEIVSYLTKTSGHTFISPKGKWVNKDGQIGVEYDYNDFTYFKVFKNGDHFTYLENGKVNQLDIDYFIKYWGNNAKDVLSKSLFWDKKMKSVKQNKWVNSEVEKTIKG
jgi:hypothetical protein